MGDFVFNPLTGEFQVADPSLQKAVKELQDEVFPLEITLASNKTTLEYTGDEYAVTLTWTCKRKGVSMIPSYVKISNGSDVIYESSSLTKHTGTANTHVSKRGATTFTLTVTANGITKTKTVSVNLILPFYIGMAEENSLDGCGKYIVTSWSNKEFAINVATADRYLTIALPSPKTLSVLTSGGFAVPYVSSTRNITIGGESFVYNVYRSESKVAQLGENKFNVTTK